MIINHQYWNFPYLPIHVYVGSNLRRPEFEFYIEPLVDTGFDGGLAVPQRVIPDSVPSIGQSSWSLADGSKIMLPSYIGYVTIGPFQPVPVVIITINGDALLGRQVTDDYIVIFEHDSRIIVRL